MTASALPHTAARSASPAPAGARDTPPPTVDELLSVAVGAVPGGTDRPGQRAMASAIAQAVATREHLLAQAGTGTGKSLAYLVPAMLVDGPVVISTATLALQSQLVDHDLPRLAAAVSPVLARRPTFAVLKGRHHYLCLARLEGGMENDQQEALFDASGDKPARWLGEAGRLGRQIQRLRDWAMETETGDRDELDPGVDDMAWRLSSMPARECVGAARCQYGMDCFAEASRERARSADIVITNHSLLAVDMMAGGHILPEHKLLIIDEAHELAERVSSASQAELTPEMVARAVRRAGKLVDADRTEALAEAGEALATGLAETTTGRLTDGVPPLLCETLALLDAAARRIFEAIGEVKTDDERALDKQQARTVLGDLSLISQRFLAQKAQDVLWTERNDRGRRALVVAPLSVSETLRSRLYADRTVILTSATLALGGTFDTIANVLGLGPTAPGTGGTASAEDAAGAETP
ncbi:MAG: ATP-dependent DNA helicase, partial [Dactylosporangium sp.]|nr:ATP-dependent DNA helicase [Dactylosporangium sp.]NNJ61829.1 ATP-dependent DNA helicase [Dactylosporangium sp.]